MHVAYQAQDEFCGEMHGIIKRNFPKPFRQVCFAIVSSVIHQVIVMSSLVFNMQNATRNIRQSKNLQQPLFETAV